MQNSSSNIRLTGRWGYGRKRNQWSSKRDANHPELQPDSEVNTFLCDELRILPDSTFLALQQVLSPLGRPARDRRAARTKALHDLVTDVFHCPHCDRRYHACGAECRLMKCPGIDCQHRVTVDRPRAVAAIVARLGELLGQDRDLIEWVVAATARLDEEGDEQALAEIAEVQRQVEASTRKIADLDDRAGAGTDEDRAETKAKVRATQAERNGHRISLERLKRAAAGRRQVDPEEDRQVLAEFATVLAAAADGQLGDEEIFRAATIFRRLIGGRVTVLAGPRARRRHPEVRGEFTPALLESLADEVGVPIAAIGPTPSPVSVWLRRPPIDGRAEEARKLHEDEHMTFKQIGMLWGQSSSPAFRAYHRYYEMIGQPAPPSTAKHGRARSKRP